MHQDTNKNNYSQSSKSWWQDPLIHFIAIGLLVFTVDKIALSEAGDENIIVVDSRVKNELIQQFKNQNNRIPTDNELNKMLDVWLQTELLYRRGLALQLDKNDPVIRDRVIQKTEFLFKNLANVEEPSEEQLRQWYKTKAPNYQKPPRYDFEHVLIRHNHNNAKHRTEQILQQVVAGTKPQRFTHDYFAVVARNRVSLRVTFGEEFVETLDQLSPGTWQVLQSKKGWHVLRLREKHETPLPPFEKIQPMLRADWYKQQQLEQVAKFIDELRNNYVINRDPT